MLHWTIWGREPGVHEASLRRYGSKLVYHITLSFFIYISYTYLKIKYIDTINVPVCILQQLLKLTATNLNASMTSAYKNLPHPDKYPWCDLKNWLHGRQVPYLKQWSIPYGVREDSYSNHTRDICQGAAESCTPMSCLHWGCWPSIWATIVRCKMVR